jgi:plasmid stabilization system protein ParE
VALEIRWTIEADGHLDEIIDYLERNWSEKEIIQFYDRLEESLQLISSNTFKVSIRKPNTHEFLLAPHTTIFYEFNESYVYILALWQNRKDPKKLI